METRQQINQNVLDNVLLKSGILTLTGAKDDIGCHLITFQSQQQLMFTQIDYSSLIESLHVVIMYYKSPLISFLVNMSHSTPMFIDHFIHVIDQLERKMSESEIKRVYIVRPERKSIQKHFAKELGNKSMKNTRINAQIVVVKSFEELYHYVNVKNLMIDFGGTLQHDHTAWLAIQKLLTHYYLLVSNITTSLSEILRRIRGLTSGDLGSRASEKSTEHTERKRQRNIEKKKNEILRQYNFTKAVEDGQRLRSYFQDPKLNETFRALSKSPVFAWDKARFQKCYREILAMKDSIEHAWKEGVGKMTSLTTEQGLYDRLIECCTWIVDKGLPYLTSLPTQSKTLAEAVKQKITFENEFYKPVKVTLKKCRKTLKEVRHHVRSLRMSSGSLELMADNLTSLMENLKTKCEERMERFKKEKDFMQSLTKAESWCDRARDFLKPGQTSTHENSSSLTDLKHLEKRPALFLERHPPLSSQELGLLLDYVENIDDLELRNRARLLGDRCQKLERELRARETHPVYASSEESMDFESSDDRCQSSYGRNSSLQCRLHETETQSSLRSTIPRDITTKRWHTPDDVMSSTMKMSRDDVSISMSGGANVRERTGKGSSRLADIQRRLRDQELLYEQLILEEELRELEAEASLGSSGSSGHQDWNDMVNADTSGKALKKRNIKEEQDRKTELRDEREEVALGLSSSRSFEHGNLKIMINPGETSGKTLENTNILGKQDTKTDRQAELGLNLSVNRSSGHRRWGNMVNLGTSKAVQPNSEDKKKNTMDLNPTDRYRFRDSQNDSKIVGQERLARLGEPGKRKEYEEVPLDLSSKLLAGCNSLKRLCELGKPASQNSSRDFESLSCDAQSLSRDADSLSRDPEIYSRDPKNKSRDREKSSRGIESSSRDSEIHSPDPENGQCDFEYDVHFESQSRDLENSSRDLKSCSRDLESCSRDLESCSRDLENESCDLKDRSHEELVKTAREAVDHWTSIKNEQRAHLAQVIDDITARKEIEESYFNAQIQICRARQNFAKLNKSNTALTTLSLNNDFINYSIMSSFNTPSELRSAGDQILNGDGAFRRFAKDDTSVELISSLHSDSNGTGYLEGGSGTLLDNEKSLGISGVIEGVEQDFGESLDSNEIPSEKADDRMRTQEYGDEVDSEDEQESSDEFDDDVEEQELMLLCSQSSSGLLSQDGLKDSLLEEQEKLEETFRRQKEQLRMEREKLKEEEKRMDEWEKNKVASKGGLATVGGNLSCANGEENIEFVENIESNILDIGNDAKLEKSEHQNVLHHLQHEIHEPQHDISVSQHERTSPRNEHRPQMDEMEETLHERPAMNLENLLSEHEKGKPWHERLDRGQEIEEHEEIIRCEGKQLHKEIQPKQSSYFNAVKQKDATNMSSLSPTIDSEFRQPKDFSNEIIDENMNIEGDVKDLSEIFVSELDSETREKIEEELIEISQKRTLKMEGEKLKERTEEFGPNSPSLGVDSNPARILDDDDDDDIDLMNQLIDDLIISDQDEVNQNDYNGIDRTPIDGINLDDKMIIKGTVLAEVDNVGISLVDDDEINEGDTRIYMNNSRVNVDNSRVGVDNSRVGVDNDGLCVDNFGIHFNDDEINQGDIRVDNEINVNGGTGSICEDDVGIDVDNVGIHLDSFGISEGDIDVDNFETNGDEPGVIVDDNEINLNIAGTYFDNVGTNRDRFVFNSDNREVHVDTTTLDVDNVRAKREQIGVEYFLKVDHLEQEKTSDHDEELDVETGIDVDFEIDLGEETEAVEGNDLIGLLRNRGDSFSSQESLDVDSVKFELSERGDKIFGASSNNISGETIVTEARFNNSNDIPKSSNQERLHFEGERISDVKREIPNAKIIGTSSDDTRTATIDTKARFNGGTSNRERFAVHKDQGAIPEGHQLQQDLESIGNSNAMSEKLEDNLSLTEATGENSRISRYTMEKSGITEDQGGIPEGHQLRRDFESIGNSNAMSENLEDNLSITEATEEHSRISGYTMEKSGITEDQGGIPEGHQLVQDSETGSDNSDDEFGRVLEDIQEEESEYEDLMGYKRTRVDSNDNEVKEQARILLPSTSDLRSARLGDHVINQAENVTSSSFTSSIIIDPGTGYCKAGFSIDDQPRVLIPSVVGKPRSQVVNSGRYNEYYVGEEAKHLHQVLDLYHPLKNGLVQDWDLMEKLLDEIYEELRCESDQYPVMFSEPVLNPKSNREEMIQVMFETFHVPAAYSCAQAVLSLFATGRTSGLVYDCGYSKAHSVPVYEGYALPHATTTTELAGHELTTCLSRMLRDRGISMESQAELDIVRNVKEKLCYVVMDYDSERKAYNIGERNDTTYTMPDGQTISLGSERFRCPEVLFAPSMVGIATDGVHEVIYKTALQCSIDVRSSLYQNVVITGGSTMFPGFCRRLHVELCKLLGTRAPESIIIDAADNRNMLTWQGGAMLSKLSNFSSMWITSSEYEEFGPGIVHKKCV